MATSKHLLRWQILTITLLVIGYSGYYLCRSNLSVAMPLIVADLAKHGATPKAAQEALGWIASWAVLAYAIGKFLSGGLSDFLGGRRNFLIGMAGSIGFTILFALGGGIPLFSIALIGNRLVQSLGWVGVVKISSRWFSFSTYGTVMAVVSLSFLFGDALARWFLGLLLKAGLDWRGLFFASAAVLFALFVINAILLKESPTAIGEAEPPSNPDNLFGAEGEKATPPGLRHLLRPMLRSPAFWFVCILSLGITLVRETFNTWIPLYFTQAVRLDVANAAQFSALFPFFGGISVLLAGFLSDRLGRGGRGSIMFIGLLLTTIVLASLGLANFGSSQFVPVALVAVVGFVMIGPYSYLAGAISLDFGGKQGSATACGIIDGVGYLGGFMAGGTMAAISVVYGWSSAFQVLAGVALLSTIVAACYWIDQRRTIRGERRQDTPVVDEIFHLFDAKGDSAYMDEPVSQLEHALQTAHHVKKQGGSETLVAAALLHDIGHLLHDLPENVADHGVDARHEVLGNNWLTKHFGPAVTEPIRLHVAAKRYLCAVDPAYAGQLSPASIQSLKLQGGPMTEAEIADFEKNAYHQDAVLLRRCDDLAKIPGMLVPQLRDYRETLERTLT